jgi:hypothetical protein
MRFASGESNPVGGKKATAKGIILFVILALIYEDDEALYQFDCSGGL